MKRFLLFLIPTLLLAEDKPAPDPQITDRQIIAYQTARADFAVAQLELSAKQKALETIVKELQATCPLTTDPQTNQPKCAPKPEPREPAK